MTDPALDPFMLLIECNKFVSFSTPVMATKNDDKHCIDWTVSEKQMQYLISFLAPCPTAKMCCIFYLYSLIQLRLAALQLSTRLCTTEKVKWFQTLDMVPNNKFQTYLLPIRCNESYESLKAGVVHVTAGIKFVNFFAARFGVKKWWQTWHHVDKILTSLLALIFDVMSGVKKSAELYSFKSLAQWLQV